VDLADERAESFEDVDGFHETRTVAAQGVTAAPGQAVFWTFVVRTSSLPI
jgi:hypothetical protein